MLVAQPATAAGGHLGWASSRVRFLLAALAGTPPPVQMLTRVKDKSASPPGGRGAIGDNPDVPLFLDGVAVTFWE